MPYPNVPKELWDKMDRCVAEVWKKNKGTKNPDGTPFKKGNAVAICHTTIMGKALLDSQAGQPLIPEDLQGVGSGAGKLSQTEVNYRKGTGEAHCGICQHFLPAEGRCQIVAGEIEADDVCDRFMKHEEVKMSRDVQSITISLIGDPETESDGTQTVTMKVATDADRKAQKARQRKYGIQIRPDGNVTKPKEYSSVPDNLFADPVNYSYPLDTYEHTVAALRYWGKAKNKAKYNPRSQAIITARMKRRAKHFDVESPTEKRQGYAFRATGSTILKKDPERHYVLGIALEPGEPGERDSQKQWIREEEIRKAMFAFMRDFQKLGKMHTVLQKGVRIIENFQAPVDMVIEGQQVRKGTWLVGTEIEDMDLWRQIEADEITGYSVGGMGYVVPG